jgi:hypothetical protein
MVVRKGGHRYIIDMSTYEKGGNTWVVRIHCQAASKSFAFAKYGGKRKALKAAIAWRNRAYQQHFGRPIKAPKRLYTKRTQIDLNVNNSSGYNGVAVSYDRRTPGVVRKYYTATWLEESGQKNKHFSVSVHGERRALELARAARAEAVRQLKAGKRKVVL